jgi:predicted ATPase
MRVLEELEITNFKKFSSLRMRLSEVQVIAGENGSGKTSILWAIMMFLRGYNSLSSNSSHFQNKTSVSNSEVAVLLNYQPLAKSESFTPFKRVGASSPPTVLVAVNNSRYTCTLTLNGKIEIEPSPMIAQNEKIRYAFVSVDSTWAAVINERNTTNTPLTSSHPSQRTRWNSLPLETRVISLISTSIHLSIQEAIRRDLEFIFAKSFIFTTPQSDEPQYVYVKEGGENAAEVEIMYTGAAFRKIFTTLLLLYTLLTAPEAQKVFLIEEPEALLYPSIHERFMQCILQLCKDKVQLIITSNSNSTFSFVDHKVHYSPVIILNVIVV